MSFERNTTNQVERFYLPEYPNWSDKELSIATTPIHLSSANNRCVNQHRRGQLPGQKEAIAALVRCVSLLNMLVRGASGPATRMVVGVLEF